MSGLRIAVVLGAVALLALLLGGALVGMTRGPDAILPALGSFLAGIGGSPTALGATGKTLTPVLLIAVAACIAFRAGFFDASQVGEFALGGLCAGAVAPALAGYGPLGMAITLLAGGIAGGAWSLMCAWLTVTTGLELVVLSLVANYLAEGLTRLLTRTLFEDPHAYSVIATRAVPMDEWLPVLLPRTNFHAGILIAISAFLLMVVIVQRTSIGHRLTMFGRNPLAAALSGVRPNAFRYGVLGLSGTICGIAGGIEVLGVYHRFQDGSLAGADSIAWTGMIAAMLVPESLLAILPASLLLSMLTSGFGGVQRDFGIPTGLATLMVGLVVVAAAFAARSTRSGRRKSRPTLPSPPVRGEASADGSTSATAMVVDAG